MNLYVGTSGYSYKEWKGSFYPEDMPADEMLKFYGERFRAVEINNTFFRMPKPAVLESWAGEVPEEFRFVLKASRVITHMKRLKDVGDPVSYLFKVAEALNERLGPVLFQTPPNLKKDIDRLREMLTFIPRDRRAAFEFRHQTWFDDEVFSLLREHGASLCLAEAEDELDIPFVATADWGYLRLRMPAYTDAEMKSWAKQVKQQKWKDAFVFFKHEDEGKGPEFANQFLEIAK